MPKIKNWSKQRAYKPTPSSSAYRGPAKHGVWNHDSKPIRMMYKGNSGFTVRNTKTGKVIKENYGGKQKEVKKKAVEWMRNHPMEEESSDSSTSYDRQY